MIAAAIVLAVIVLFVLIALLRFSVFVEYSSEGVIVTGRAVFFKFQFYPSKEETEEEVTKKERKKARKKDKKRKKELKKKAEKEPEEKKPGTLKTVQNMLPDILKGLNRLRRRLLVKRLTLHLALANDDPYKAAMTFGYLNSAIGTVLPLLEKSLRIKRRDFQTAVDFEAAEHYIYINAAISIAVWEAVYITWALVPTLLKTFGKKKTTRKDDNGNGQAPNKRAHGNDDAEGQGDDRRQHDNRRAGIDR